MCSCNGGDDSDCPNLCVHGEHKWTCETCINARIARDRRDATGAGDSGD